MLAIASKLAEPVDWTKPVGEYCSAAFGAESALALKSLLSTIEELRLDALSASSAEAQRMGIRRYLGALALLEDKFPLTQPISALTKVSFPSVPFVWADSFRPRLKVKSSSVRFERACMVFNLAASQSLLARDTDRSSSEGQKTAVALFQTAAGIFLFLRESILPSCVGESVGVDLSDAAVSMCASLMLAQAQALFYEKAVKDKSTRSLLAKLANQAGQFYETAAESTALKDHLDPSWTSHCQFQAILFSAAAHFQQAMADKPNVTAKLSGFGQLVARLRLARDIANSADGLGMNASVMSSIKPLKDAIRTELTAVEYDNTNVYIEVVPDKSALLPIGLVPAVKPAAVNLTDLVDSEYLAGFVGVLDGLAPVEVKQKAEQLEIETTRIIGKLNAAVAALRVSKLPASLSLAPGAGILPPGESPPALSDELWSKIARIQVLGGPLALDGLVATLHGATGESEGLISAIQRILEDEERSDKSYRDKFGPIRYNCVASTDLTGNFKTQLSNYKAKLQLALETNRKVRDRIASQDRNLVGHLGKSRTELDAIWGAKWQAAQQEAAAKAFVLNPATEELKRVCRDQVARMESLVADLSALGAKFVAKFDLSASVRIAELVKAGAIDQYSTALIAEAENESNALIAEINGSFASASADLDHAYHALMQHVSDVSPSNASNFQNANWMHALGSCASIVLQGFSDVSEGVTFFGKLNDYLRKLKLQIDDFCFARNAEKTGVMRNIERSLAAGHNSAGDAPQINFGI